MYCGLIYDVISGFVFVFKFMIFVSISVSSVIVLSFKLRHTTSSKRYA